MVTRQNDSTGTAIYQLGDTGNGHFAGDVTMGKVDRAFIPQPNTLTLYTTDATSLNMIDTSGAITSISTGSGAVPAAVGPSIQNLIAWNMDAELAGSTSILASGTLYMHKIVIPVATTITNILLDVTTAGSTLTAGQSFAGLYSQNGTTATLLSSSASQSTTWASTGTKTVALATPQTVAAGTYFIGMFSVGTTPPTFASSPGFQNAYNAGLTVSAYRHATNVTGQTTALPTTVTLASNVSTPVSIWVGLN